MSVRYSILTNRHPYMATILKNLLHNFLSHKTEHPWKVNLLSQWGSIVGNLSSKVMIEKIYEDTIVLGVYESCWMQELYLLSPLLIANINSNLDQPRIKKLRFKLVQQYAEKKDAVIQTKHVIPKNNRALNMHEEKALSTIQDPALREALKNYLFRCAKEKL